MVSAACKDLRETERENFILSKEVDTLRNPSILMKNQKQNNIKYSAHKNRLCINL